MKRECNRDIEVCLEQFVLTQINLTVHFQIQISLVLTIKNEYQLSFSSTNQTLSLCLQCSERNVIVGLLSQQSFNWSSLSSQALLPCDVAKKFHSLSKEKSASWKHKLMKLYLFS